MIEGSATARESLPAPAVEAVVDETVETLRKICGKKPAVSAGDDVRPGEGLTAVIGYDGELRFELAFGIPRETARPLATKFAGVPIDYDCDVMPDMIGEIVNVIAGAVAARLQTTGFETSISLPRVGPTADDAGAGTVLRTAVLDAGFGPMYVTIRDAENVTVME